MPNPYTFIPGALPQAQMQRIYAEVGHPAPTAFTDPLVLMSPDWSPDIPLETVFEWPADHGSALPVVGDQVLLEQDSRGFWRVASWGHATTTWGGVTLPPNAPSGSNKTILSNGTGGSSWTTITAAGSAGGDLTGTYPNPTVASVLSGKVPVTSDSGSQAQKTGNTGIITVGAFTAGTWTSVAVAHGLGVIPKGFGGHLIGTSSPSIVTGIPVTSAYADATNLNFLLFNTSAFNLTSGSINLNWWATH